MAPWSVASKQPTAKPIASDDGAASQDGPSSPRELLRSCIEEPTARAQSETDKASTDALLAETATPADEPLKKEGTDQSATENSHLVPDADKSSTLPAKQEHTTMQSDPNSTKEFCSFRRVFGSAAVAAFVAASSLTTLLTVKPGATVWGYPLPFSGPSAPADNTSMSRIPLRLPQPLRRAFATNGFAAEVNRSSAEGLLQGIAQDIEEEARARKMKEWASQGGLIDVPVRDFGPQCKQGGHNCEWVIISAGPIHVREQPHFDAPTLAMKTPGSIVVGRAENNAWLRLAGEGGFVAFEIDGFKLVKQRDDIWYEKIVHGSCADIGRNPILDARSCEVAAMTLGLAVVGPFDEPLRVLFDSADNDSMLQDQNTTVEEASRRLEDATLQVTDDASAVPANSSLVQANSSLPTDNASTSTAAPWDDGSRPEGCYIDATGTLRMNLQPHNIGNGVLGDMQPICATMAYPSTNTTTSTTSTTRTTTRSYGEPSFMCFSYMRRWTIEEQLVKQQMWKGAGIFACEQTVVVSSGKYLLGTNQYGEDIYTWANPPPSNTMGNLAAPGVTTNSWLNSLTFIIAINTILNDSTGRIWSTDFFVKADPDAILLPDRLRNHARPHVGAPVYFLNCGHNGASVLYGAVEIYSKQAMGLYKNGHDRCMNSLNWRGWGEDSFFASCMAMLGAQGVSDFSLVGDSRCSYAPCTDPWRAAFHPFKDVGSWVYCWRQATNIWD